jgi:hypothetical protein
LIVRFSCVTGPAWIIAGIKPIDQSFHNLVINLETIEELLKNTEPCWVWRLISVTTWRPEVINGQLAILVRNP